AMAVYQNDNDQAWPVLQASAANTVATGVTSASAANSVFTTMVSFEFLANSTGGDLTGKVFGCPANSSVKPTTTATAISWTTTTAATWATTPATANTNSAAAYAYDWAVPSNATSNRVVLADRPKASSTATDNSNHKSNMVVVFADGHVGNLNKVTSVTVAGNATINQGNAAVAGVWGYVNKDADATDNIYDDNTDGGSTLTNAGGGTTKAYVK
ncbi:MAG: hypothetical protein L6R48_12645, partial [Planctomycetes bacterium]|nr:hypothetical protein [Planctomycetota bacterium]